MAGKFVGMYIDEGGRVTIAITENGDIYARPGLLEYDRGKRELIWSRARPGWRHMGNALEAEKQDSGT